MISSRYAPALGVLVALALVPAVIHAYLGTRVSDGLRTASIPLTLAGYAGTATERDEGWGNRRFESFDWIERQYVSGEDDLVLTVVRSFDLKSVYHHPELAVAYGVPFVRHEVVRLPSRPDVPVHVLWPETGRRAIGLYVLHYDGRFVQDPIGFQLRTSLELLVSSRKPMTLFFVQDADAPPDPDVAGLGAARVLVASMDAFGGSARDAAK